MNYYAGILFGREAVVVPGQIGVAGTQRVMTGEELKKADEFDLDTGPIAPRRDLALQKLKQQVAAMKEKAQGIQGVE